MNHVYKVVWSKTKQCYVVASEFAKRSGKAAGKAAVLAAIVATTASVAVPAQAAPKVDTIPGGYQVTTGDTKASVSESGAAAIKGNGGATLMENGIALRKGDSTISVKENGIALTGKNVTVNGTNVGDLATQTEQNKKDIANLTYNTATQLGEVKQDIKDNQKEISNIKDNLNYQTAEQNKERVDALKKDTDKKFDSVNQNISDLAQNTKENFDSVGKQLAGQAEVNKQQDQKIDANSQAIKEQAQVNKNQDAVIQGHYDEFKQYQDKNDTKNAEQDKAIDTNKWKAETALKQIGNGVLNNHGMTLTDGINLNTQAIEKEQAARKDADAQLQTNIDNEATARKDADTKLQANIDSEATARKDADTKLQTNIDTEATARQTADAEIMKSFQSADSQLSNRIDSVDSHSKKGIAGVAALAALQPLDFDPDAKWDFAAGYGNYRGENATALGMYYRPNEDVMISVGGTIGNSDNNSVNAGLSLKLGAGSSHVNNSRTAMAKEIKDLRDTVSKQDAQIQKLAAMVNALLGTNEQLESTTVFPDVPENHWAYEAVSTMAKNGLVKGYPDGEFKGDRTMTRYEFAQIIYNAVQQGAKVDSRLVAEFQKELQYFHIDTVAKDKDGNATIERVRVNK